MTNEADPSLHFGFILAIVELYAIIARMIPRLLFSTLQERLAFFPAVALLGPRQVGKTTLAETIGQSQASIYLDLENPADREKLQDAALYLSAHQDKLVILDEIQRVPELFQALRGLIDQGRRQGRTAGHYLLLGSASMDLLHQSGESLAGRIAYLELSPLNLMEVSPDQAQTLWVRGGFPDSFLANTEANSYIWRENFIRTYLERDIPQLGPRIPAETLRRFWTMLAHTQGGLLNAAKLAQNLAVDGKTIARYLDLLVDLLLVRRLPPWSANTGKRLVKSPKTYVRDSGLLHTLLGLSNYETLLGHPVVGASWEGFVIETLLTLLPNPPQASFYRTSAGAEIDLLLELPDNQRWAIEIKRSLVPKVERGFYNACEDVQPNRAFVVYAGFERFPVSQQIEAISLPDLAQELLQFQK